MTDGYPLPGTPMRIGHMSEMIGSMHEYETHVTVRCADAAELARLDAWAAARS